MNQSSSGLATSSDLFSKKEIQAKPGQNHLIYSLGDEVLNVHVSGPIILSSKDSIVLSSDGLTANLSQKEIAEITTQGQAKEKVSKLFESAQKIMTKGTSPGSNPDDLSIILFNSDRKEEVAVEELEKPLKK